MGIYNSSSYRREEKALPQFWQGSGPVTSCMYACSGSGRQPGIVKGCLFLLMHYKMFLKKEFWNPIVLKNEC